MKRFLFLFVVLVCTASVYADKTDDFIRSEMEKSDIPGLALMIIKNGKAAKAEGYGYASLEWKDKVTRDTVFEIGSVTKQFTAAGIMLLVQDGKLSLDDPISKHLKNTPPHWQPITVRHLLNHTSGIKSYTSIEKGFEVTERLTQERFIQLLAPYPLEFKTGSTWKYCNSTYSLLGYIIENLSGKNYWTFMGERIFGPLGMNATTNRDPSIIVAKRAYGYEKNRKGQRINRDYDLTDVFSAGAIISTLGDMAKWDAALNGDKILTAASKKELWTPTRLSTGEMKNYGLGWYVDELEGHKNIGHSGSTSGFSASFQRFPDQRMTVLLFCNSGESGVATRLAKQIATMHMPRLVAEKSAKKE